MNVDAVRDTYTNRDGLGWIFQDHGDKFISAVVIFGLSMIPLEDNIHVIVESNSQNTIKLR